MTGPLGNRGETQFPVNLDEYETLARASLDHAIFDFIAGGADDEVTLRENRTAFDRWRILPRILSGVCQPDLSTTILGQRVSMPIVVAPMGLHQLACAEGELASAAASEATGTIFSLGIAASAAMEDVAAVTRRWWFQIYLLQDRGLTLDHVRRAEAAGASAIILTVDVAVRGRREADIRNAFELPPGMTMPNLLPREHTGELPSYAVLTAWDTAITWRDLDWLCAATTLPVIVKGVLAPEDATMAIEHGARGVSVSNHGGRQLDSSPAAISALSAVADALQGRATLLLDGGIRRGTDVLKALALGADAVMVGRPILYGLAADGELGASRVLQLLRAELTTDMTLAGIPAIAAIERDVLIPA